MKKEDLQTIIAAMDKGFKDDCTESLGAVYREAKKYLEDA